MEYQLKIQPWTNKKGKYKVIQITDIAFHTNAKRESSTVKVLGNILKPGGSGRIYSPIEHSNDASNSEFVLEMLKNDPELIKVIREQEELGFKVLLSIPKKGIPVYPGKDTQEFIESTKGKRIMRRLYKKK